MKKLWLAGALAAALAAFTFGQNPALAQNQQQDEQQAQVMGRGRGGAPWAWNNKDKDGICDLTGKPVGEGRAIRSGGGRGRGWGRGMAAGQGRGRWCRGAGVNRFGRGR
jgi:hypothetical protein